MAAIPQPQHTTAAAIYALHAQRVAAEQPRGYLGISQLGHPCERYLWLSWRWVAGDVPDARMARLFDTGHREEARVLDELRQAGMTVWDRDEFGRQFAVEAVHGHLRGHMDAVVTGLPEAPKTPHLVDVKTANTKKFGELLKKGMRAVYPKYWAQAQGYMGLADLTRAAFIFVCKDDDRIHVERLEFDRVEFERLMARAERIVTAAEPPARLGETADALDCRWCAFREHCHGQAVAEVNCRTCAHATAVTHGEPGEWRCALENVALDLPTQRAGCNGHRFIPVLLERVATQIDAADEPGGNLAVTYRLPDGSTFVNGYPPAFSSAEIAAAQAGAQMLGDEQVQAIKAQVPTARLVAAQATEAACL